MLKSRRISPYRVRGSMYVTRVSHLPSPSLPPLSLFLYLSLPPLHKDPMRHHAYTQRGPDKERGQGTLTHETPGSHHASSWRDERTEVQGRYRTSTQVHSWQGTPRPPTSGQLPRQAQCRVLALRSLLHPFPRFFLRPRESVVLGSPARHPYLCLQM